MKKTKQRQGLEGIILNSLWDLSRIIPENPHPKLLQILDYVVTHPPKKDKKEYFASISQLAIELSDYERLKKTLQKVLTGRIVFSYLGFMMLIIRGLIMIPLL